MTAEQFTCGVCAEDFEEEQPHFIAGDPLCLTCADEYIVPLFKQALEFEFHYPPKWGPVVIEPIDFADVLTPDFLTAYATREIEYNTKPCDRLYCSHDLVATEDVDSDDSDDPDTINAQDVVMTADVKLETCNAFLGKKQSTNPGTVFRHYPRCTGLVCTSCTKPLTGTDMPHDCANQSSAADDTAFNGLDRGVHWQACPNCDCRVELSEACNEMTCHTCTRHFCFICAKELPLSGETDHFMLGVCPRWGPLATAQQQHYDLPPQQLGATLGIVMLGIHAEMLDAGALAALEDTSLEALRIGLRAAVEELYETFSFPQDHQTVRHLRAVSTLCYIWQVLWLYPSDPGSVRGAIDWIHHELEVAASTQLEASPEWLAQHQVLFQYADLIPFRLQIVADLLEETIPEDELGL